MALIDAIIRTPKAQKEHEEKQAAKKAAREARRAERAEIEREYEEKHLTPAEKKEMAARERAAISGRTLSMERAAPSLILGETGGAMTHIKAAPRVVLVGCEHESKLLELAINGAHPALITGETGTGKTHILRHLAEKLDKTVIRLSLNGEIGINELLGKWLIRDGATYWQDGILTDAMRRGHWIIFDEINAALPEVLFCLNSLLDDGRSIVLAEKDGEHVRPHAEFRLFATMNPPDEYAGTKELNKALLSRFTMVLRMDYAAPAMEKRILKSQTGITGETAAVLVDIGNAIRTLKSSRLITYTCSTRDLVNWARLIMANGHTLADTFEVAILNKAADEDKPQIMQAAKAAAEIEVNWKARGDVGFKLTADMKKEVESLEAKRVKLSALISDLETKTNELKAEVRA